MNENNIETASNIVTGPWGASQTTADSSESKNIITVANVAEMLTLNASEGDVVFRQDDGNLYILSNEDASAEDSWLWLQQPSEVIIENEDACIMPDDSEPTFEIEDTAEVDPNEIAKMIAESKKLVEFFQNTWNLAKEEFGITEEHLTELIRYNTEARVPGDEDDESYDEFNGIMAIPMERVASIFGADSKIFGVEPSHTIDRLRYVANIFTELFKAHRELHLIDEEFAKIMEENERESVKTLQAIAENDPSEEVRAKATSAIERYFNTKHLGFLLDIGEETIEYLIKCFTDQARIRYLLNRARAIMARQKFPEIFLLEIASFEKRFLPEKYHSQNNLMLLLYLQKVAYLKAPEDKLSIAQLHSMMLGIDQIARHVDVPDVDAIKENIMKFHDLFIDRITGTIDQIDIGDIT